MALSGAIKRNVWRDYGAQKKNRASDVVRFLRQLLDRFVSAFLESCSALEKTTITQNQSVVMRQIRRSGK